MDFITKTLKRPARIAALGLFSIFLAAPAALAGEIVQCTVPKDLSNPDDNSGKCGSHSPASVTLTAEGQYADFTATPAAGYVFKYWQNLNNQSTTSDNPLRVAYSDSIDLLQIRAWFAPTYDVTLNPCGGVWQPDDTNLVRVIYGETYGELDSPTRYGYSFVGWFTQSSGGEQVTASTTVTSASAHTLYAHWNGDESTLTFNPNGGTFADPGKATRTVAYGSPYGALPDAADVSKPGNSLYGWLKVLGDRTTRISASAIVYETSAFTVYAEWIPANYTVAFDGNGATSGSMEPVSCKYGDPDFTLPANKFRFPGHEFLCWNTKADGTGNYYADQEKNSTLATTDGATVTLYAQWRESGYVVAFDGGSGGEGEMPPVSFPRDVESNLPSNAFVRVGYVFAGWNDSLNATVHADGAAVLNLAPEGTTNTLVATWVPVDYTVSFKRGVATAKGEMDDLPCVYDSPTNLPPCTISNPLGAFRGWALDPYATDPDFADEAAVTNLATILGAVVPLFAVWDATLTDLSRAIGCDTLQLNSTGPDPWTVTNDAGGACLVSGYNKSSKRSELTAKADGPGTLSFEWCVSGGAALQRTVSQKGVKIGSGALQPVTNDVAAITIGKWYSKSVPVPDGANLDVIWYSNAFWNEDPEYDEGRLFIKNVAWIPDADSNLVYTVRFDPNGGSGEMADKTCLTGVAATLPSNAFFYDSDHDFDHWHDPLNNRDYSDGATVVDLAPGGGTNTLVAVWSVPPPLTVVAEGWSGPYDGSGHGISVSVAEPGASIGYALSAAGPFLPDNPLYINATNATVWYVASLAGYASTTGSAEVTISPAVNAWTVQPSIAGWTEGEDPSVPVAEAAFGEVEVTYSSGGTTPPTAPGDYYATFVVAEAENWTGLSNNVAFTIAKYVPPPPPPAMPLLWPDDGPYDGSVARVYDGWALSPDGALVAVIQLKAKKLQAKGGVASFAATATAKDSAARTLKYSKGVGSPNGVVSGFVCTTKDPSVATFDATLGADNLSGEWGGYEIFGARNGMGTKGDKMAVALESYRGDWTITLTNATGTTSLMLNVGARGATKISGTAAGGFKVKAKVQSVMGEDGLYIPYLAVLKRGSASYGASLLVRLAPDGSVDVISSSLGTLADGHIGPNPIVISPVIETGDGAGVPLEQGALLKFSVGIAQRISLDMVGQPGVATTLKAKGLPSGLKLVKSKTIDASGATVTAYAIAGVPKKAQAAKQVVLTATNKSKWKGVFAFNVEVAALPAAAVGTYNGSVVAADAAKSVGAFTLKFSAVGKITGNFTIAGKRVVFKAASLDRIEEATGGFVAKISYKLNGVQYSDDEILIALDPDEGVYCAALLSAPSGVLADAVAYWGR